MSNSLHFPKNVKGIPNIVTLQNNLHEFMESVEKCKEEGEPKLYEYI